MLQVMVVSCATLIVWGVRTQMAIIAHLVIQTVDFHTCMAQSAKQNVHMVFMKTTQPIVVSLVNLHVRVVVLVHSTATLAT